MMEMIHQPNVQTQTNQQPNSPTVPWKRFYQGILWKEWRVHSSLINAFLAMWFVGLFVLLFIYHPLILSTLTAIYALAAGARIGGSDVGEDCEEFVFALPPTRSHLFLLRFALGLGPLLLMLGIGLPAIVFDWPQNLWSLAVDSGFTESFAYKPWIPFIGYAAILPVFLYTVTFVLSAGAPGSDLANKTFLHSIFLAFLFFVVGVWLEIFIYGGERGDLVIPQILLAAVTVVFGLGGFWGYLHKEGVFTGGRARTIFNAASVGLVWLLFTSLLLFFSRS